MRTARKADAPNGLAADGASNAARESAIHQPDYSTAVKTVELPDLSLIKGNKGLAVMRSLRQWVAFEVTWNASAGKFNKRPVNPHSGDRLFSASIDDATTWSSFDQAAAFAKAHGLCIGFAITATDPFCGIDFDHCVGAGGEIKPEVKARIEAFDSYAEYSISGTGVHLFIKGKKREGAGTVKHEAGIEIYDSRHYLVMTGCVIDNHNVIEPRQELLTDLCNELWPVAAQPTARPVSTSSDGIFREGIVESDQDIIEKMLRYPKISALWEGNWHGRYRSPSEADFALADHLVWWCGGNLDQADRLFRFSALYRPKWDEKRDKDTYGQITLRNALAGKTSFREPGRYPVEELAEIEAPAETATVGLPKPKMRYSLDELLSAEFPDPQWAIPDLLPEGLTFLAGRPKLGKSWLALQIAIAVSCGGKVLNKDVTKGNVLYLALEDSPRRIKDRIVKQGGSAGHITFCFSWRPLTQGGFNDLQKELEENDYRLCVIDTFSRISGKADQNDVRDMTNVLGQLQQLALIKKMAILMIDHHHKLAQGSQSEIDDVLGSTGKTATADCSIGLYREQGKQGTILKLTGRDVEQRELSLSWDPTTCCWQYMGDAGEVRRESVRGEVLEAIRYLNSCDMLTTSTAIAKHLGKSQANISRELADLLNTGKLKKGARVGKEVPYLIP